MLELSPRAAAALESLREIEGIPEDHGTRLTGQPQPTGDLAVHLEFVESVPEDDQVVEHAGIQVHVDPQIAEPLSDVVMDVQQSEQGEAFVFVPQDA
jgi:Fe-S cluster assembly iron-binding protein IscA